MPPLDSLIKLFGFYRAPIVLLERVPMRLVPRFGVVDVQPAHSRPKFLRGRMYQVSKVVEKPPLKTAPSNLTVVGGYILTPRVLRSLKLVSDSLPVVADDAIPINIGLQIELVLGGKVYGWEFPGNRLDCGTPERLKQAEKLLLNHGTQLRPSYKKSI